MSDPSRTEKLQRYHDWQLNRFRPEPGSVLATDAALASSVHTLEVVQGARKINEDTWVLPLGSHAVVSRYMYESPENRDRECAIIHYTTVIP